MAQSGPDPSVAGPTAAPEAGRAAVEPGAETAQPVESAQRPERAQTDESTENVAEIAEPTEPGRGQEGGETGPAIGELEDRLRRALADADNLRKRTERQIADARAAERVRVAAAWLPIVDNLERALEHAGTDAGPVVEGIRAVREQAVAVLATLGYARHDETGVAFDPYVHEAVGVQPLAGTPAGTVLQVLRPGYGEGTQQLRPAAVVVAAGPE